MEGVRKMYGVVEYVGTKYRGWQYQGMGDQSSISGVLQHFLGLIIPQEKCPKFTLTGASRTDAGVHARGNAFHIQLHYNPGAIPLPEKAFSLGLNSYLKKADHPIRVLEIREVPVEFNAVRSNKKTYRYQAITESSIFYQDRYMLLPKPINLPMAQAAARMLTGRINILSFSKRSPDKLIDPEERVIDDIKVEEDGKEVMIDVKSSGFSWYQVRYMAGCILQCGMDKMPLEQVSELLTGKSKKMAPLAPPHGLYLQEVVYDPKWFRATI